MEADCCDGGSSSAARHKDRNTARRGSEPAAPPPYRCHGGAAGMELMSFVSSLAYFKSSATACPSTSCLPRYHVSLQIHQQEDGSSPRLPLLSGSSTTVHMVLIKSSLRASASHCFVWRVGFLFCPRFAFVESVKRHLAEFLIHKLKKGEKLRIDCTFNQLLQYDKWISLPAKSLKLLRINFSTFHNKRVQ